MAQMVSAATITPASTDLAICIRSTLLELTIIFRLIGKSISVPVLAKLSPLTRLEANLAPMQVSRCAAASSS